MSSIPLISVVMNCYNSDEYLKDTIESVLSQTYKNFEIIFWDNQSTDNSAKIIKSYNDKRIKYFYASKFTPLGEARNFAIGKCSGEWIAFLDCDDIWDKNKLEYSFLELVNSNDKENIALIYSKSNIIDKGNNIISLSGKVLSGNIHERLLIDGNFIIFSSIIVRKDILNQSGNIDEKLNYCEDYDLLLKVCKNYSAIGVAKYLTSYRMHSNNITSRKIYENDIEVIKLLKKYTENNNLPFVVKFNIWVNNSYRIGSLVIKLLIRKKFQNFGIVIQKYFYYFLLSPLAIVKINFFSRDKNE